jgi:dipeptide transport system permease protein
MTETHAKRPPAASRSRARAAAGSREFWYYFSENRGAVIGLVVFVAARRDRDRAPTSSRPIRRPAIPRCLMVPPFWQEGGSDRASCSAPTRSAATSSRA